MTKQASFMVEAVGIRWLHWKVRLMRRAIMAVNWALGKPARRVTVKLKMPVIKVVEL